MGGYDARNRADGLEWHVFVQVLGLRCRFGLGLGLFPALIGARIGLRDALRELPRDEFAVGSLLRALPSRQIVDHTRDLHLAAIVGTLRVVALVVLADDELDFVGELHGIRQDLDKKRAFTSENLRMKTQEVPDFREFQGRSEEHTSELQ